MTAALHTLPAAAFRLASVRPLRRIASARHRHQPALSGMSPRLLCTAPPPPSPPPPLGPADYLSAPRADLHAALAASVTTFLRDALHLAPDATLTPAVLAAASAHLPLPPAVPPAAAAEALRRAVRPFHVARHADVRALVAATLASTCTPFAALEGRPLLTAVLSHALAADTAVNPRLLARLTGTASPVLPHPCAALHDVVANLHAAHSALHPVLTAAVRDRVPARELRIPLLRHLRDHALPLDTLPDTGSVFLSPDTAPACAFATAVTEYLHAPHTGAPGVVGALCTLLGLLDAPVHAAVCTALAAHYPTLPSSIRLFRPSQTNALLQIASEAAIEGDQARAVVHGMYVVADLRAAMNDALELRADSMRPPVAESARVRQRRVPTGSTAQLYDAQAGAWVRRSPRVLSDFTGRPAVLELLQPAAGCTVLDVGCGEGYVARALRTEHGVCEVLGVDVSAGMVAAATREEQQRPLGGLQFVVGDATDVETAVQAAALGRMQGVVLPGDTTELFDSAVACFVFNYLTVAEMRAVMQGVFRLLKPGGKFVFSVPHPCFPFWQRADAQRDARFGFEGNLSDYLADEDVIAEGVMATRDGGTVCVRNSHKTVVTYLDSLREAGFLETPVMRELGVTDELLDFDRDFFTPLKGAPLHMAFSVRKPTNTPSRLARGWRRKEIFWTSDISLRDLELTLPEAAVSELSATAHKFVADGRSPDDLSTDYIKRLPLRQTRAAASEILARLSGNSGHGAVLVHGLPDDATDENKTLRMGYFLLATVLGRIQRNRTTLWDVFDRVKDAGRKDVLFSSSSKPAPFHSDSSPRNLFPDVVGLLCQTECPSGGGGLKLVAAAPAVRSMRTRPVENEVLRRAIPRVRVQRGLSPSGWFGEVHTAEDVPGMVQMTAAKYGEGVALRTADNRYAIIEGRCVDGEERWSVRLMRDWVEMGYEQLGVDVPHDVQKAMDAFDEELQKAPQVSVKLRRGQALFLNNHGVLHAREGFQVGSPRVSVRVWIAVEE